MYIIGGLSRYTGGQVYQYTSLSEKRHHVKVANDITRNITRFYGLEAVMRVRCSQGNFCLCVVVCYFCVDCLVQGLSVKRHFGNYFIRSANLLSLPNIDADKAIAVQFQLDKDLTKNFVYIQAALLYDPTLKLPHNLNSLITKVHNELF